MPVSQINPEQIKPSNELLQSPKAQLLQSQFNELRPRIADAIGSQGDVEGVVRNVIQETLQGEEGNMTADELFQAAVENLEDYINKTAETRINLQQFIRKTNLKIIAKESEGELDDLQSKLGIDKAGLQQEFIEEVTHVYDEYVASNVITKNGRTAYAGDKPRIRKEIAAKAIEALKNKYENETNEKARTRDQEINIAQHKIKSAMQNMLNRDIGEQDNQAIDSLINRYFDTEVSIDNQGKYEVNYEQLWHQTVGELRSPGEAQTHKSLEELLNDEITNRGYEVKKPDDETANSIVNFERNN